MMTINCVQNIFNNCQIENTFESEKIDQLEKKVNYLETKITEQQKLVQEQQKQFQTLIEMIKENKNLPVLPIDSPFFKKKNEV